MSKNPRRVLVIAPHPDDESFGCGGTLLKHKAGGDSIFWLIITNVLVSEGWPKEMVETRQKEIESVARKFSFKKIMKLDFPTTKLDIIPLADMIGKISDAVMNIKPDIVYIPNPSDVHSDHRITFQAAYSCTKNFRFPFIRRVLAYESLSETDFSSPLSESQFIPNVFIDISSHFSRKLEILKIFRSEIMPSPLPRSLETITALAKYRGSRIGTAYAEAFALLHERN